MNHRSFIMAHFYKLHMSTGILLPDCNWRILLHTTNDHMNFLLTKSIIWSMSQIIRLSQLHGLDILCHCGTHYDVMFLNFQVKTVCFPKVISWLLCTKAETLG